MKKGKPNFFGCSNMYESNSLTFQAAQREWQTIKQEMVEQDQLITWIRGSGVGFEELKQLFATVAPMDYAAYPHSVEALVAEVWEIPAGHEPLLSFVFRLQKYPALPVAIRHQFESWCARAQRNEMLRLSGEAVPTDQADDTRLIVKIESGKQDLSERLVTLWISQGGKFEKLLDLKVEANQLELMVSQEINEWTVAYGSTEVIEFYLPKALLAVPVDAWQIRIRWLQERFVERYKVIKGILERQEARAIRAQLKHMALPDEKRRLVRVVCNNPLMWELVRRSKDGKRGGGD